MPLVCGLEGQEGCKVAANILHGLDCRLRDITIGIHNQLISMLSHFRNF